MVDAKGPYRRYILVLALLFLLAFAFQTVIWKSDVHVHTILEVIATVVAAVVGSLALVRFYSKKSNRFLFIGTGFIATAFLDGYHGLVTSDWFYQRFTENLSDLAPWSWLVSRLFLSILLWLSVVARPESDKRQNQRGELRVYLIVSLLGLLFFIFFTQDQLPQAYLQDWILHRPMELVPAFFFLLALLAYYRAGDWRTDAFSQWVLLALIVSFFVQTFFMPFSNELYDGMFDVAHLLKIVSYIFVFIGLASSMSEIVKQVEEGSKLLQQVNSELQHEVLERKEAEEQLRQRSTQLAEAQELAHLGSWTWDLASGQIGWSNELYRIFGYEPQSFLVTINKFMEHVHPDDQEMVKSTLQRVLDSHEELSYYPRIVRPDGEVRILHGRGSVVIDENKQPVRMWGTAQDVTERQRASDALQKSELMFRSVAESANDAIISANSQGKIIFWNSAAQRIFGYEEREALGMRLTELMLESYIRGHNERVSELPSEKIEVIGESLEMEARHKEGRRFPIEVSLASWKVSEEDFYTAIIRDITKRKRREEELNLFSAKLEASNRELQEFAYIASHDLQEPLRKINAFSDRLKSRYGESLPDRAKDYLDRMQSAATRMQRLIEDLLSLSRVTTKGRPFVEVDLMKVANEVLEDLETSIEQSNGEVQIAPLPTIDADPTQMRQFFQNTIGNALKFSRRGVPPVVKITTRSLVNENGHEQQIEIRVQDNGIGFKEKYLDRIFQPFQRLHGRTKYAGTGMGLAICRKIAERHGGTITATSVPEEGTTIIMTLPIEQLFGQDRVKESTL